MVAIGTKVNSVIECRRFRGTRVVYVIAIELQLAVDAAGFDATGLPVTIGATDVVADNAPIPRAPTDGQCGLFGAQIQARKNPAAGTNSTQVGEVNGAHRQIARVDGSESCLGSRVAN